jgi:hypothetical protein
MMVIRGLEKYGYNKLASELAMEHLQIVNEVFQTTDTIWENYSPDESKPGSKAKPDFVGWSGLGPILFFIEYGIGIKADALSNTITWKITSDKQVGIKNFRFGGKTTTLLCDESNSNKKRKISVKSDSSYVLIIKWQEKTERVEIPGGKEVLFQI